MASNKCPYCDYVTPEAEPGTARAWQEIAHMQLNHPEIIAERLQRIGIFDMSPRFAERYDVTPTDDSTGDAEVKAPEER